jgi:hypothetical protein
MLAVNNKWKILKHETSEYFIAALINKGLNNLVVASVYIPPSTSRYAPASYAYVVEDLCTHL